jgi:hypothetical protein
MLLKYRHIVTDYNVWAAKVGPLRESRPVDKPVRRSQRRQKRIRTTTHRLIHALAAIIAIGGAIPAMAQETRLPPPQGARLLLETTARGVQIYSCEKGEPGYRWIFVAPEADLFDTAGRQIGTHFAGPSWQLRDGSKIVGEVLAQAAALNAIPWLLLRAKSHEGNGGLSDAGLVRRVDTVGGTAPTAGCDAATAPTRARLPYTARYLFYAAP